MKYATFQTSNQFELWQINNPTFIICLIQPIPINFRTEQSSVSCSRTDLILDIFVTYFEDNRLKPIGE